MDTGIHQLNTTPFLPIPSSSYSPSPRQIRPAFGKTSTKSPARLEAGVIGDNGTLNPELTGAQEPGTAGTPPCISDNGLDDTDEVRV